MCEFFKFNTYGFAGKSCKICNVLLCKWQWNLNKILAKVAPKTERQVVDRMQHLLAGLGLFQCINPHLILKRIINALA